MGTGCVEKKGEPMEPKVNQALVEKAREIGPLIEAHAAEAERERRLSREVVEALSRPA